MYIKFVITGALAPNYYAGHYYNLNGFKFYDINNNVISDLNSIDNLISQTYNARNGQSNTDAWFDPIIGNHGVPYNSSSNISQAIIIIKINKNTINKIDLYPYSNDGGGKYVDIYYSGDNINYKLSERVTFLNTSTIVSTTKKIIIGLFLIKQQGGYYSIISDFYHEDLDVYDSHILSELNISNFNNYGLDDLSLIHSNALLKLIENKYNLSMLK